MTWIVIVLAGGTMLTLAVFIGYVLGWANRTFHVEVSPLVEKALAMLPGANCGGCGYVGCSEYAEAVAAGKVPPTKCPVGGVEVSKALAGLLGLDLKESWPYRPVVHCGATYGDRLGRAEYRGEPTCGAGNILAGVQACTYGCMGFGDCEQSCRFDAIHIVDGLATVDYDKCTGCGACEKVCPRHIISMVPFKTERMLIIQCSNKDFGKDVKAVCKVGCIGCKACQRTNEMFTVLDNLPRVDYDKYDPAKLGDVTVVINKCPMKRIVYVGKPSEKDRQAVAEEKVPTIVAAKFKTTADKADWHG